MKKYKNLWYSKEKKDKIIDIDGKKFYRYMDKIYIPEKPELLSKEDSNALSELRVLLDKDVIDYKYSSDVSHYLLSFIDNDYMESLIDFGCGGGFLLNLFHENNLTLKNYYGLDSAKKSLDMAKENVVPSNITLNFEHFEKKSKLKLKDNTIDNIISCFVMHFPVSNNQLDELYRVLKPNGKFIYNDFNYNKSKETTYKKIQYLEDIGFKIELKDMTFNQNNKQKHHKIIIATKKAF